MLAWLRTYRRRILFYDYYRHMYRLERRRARQYGEVIDALKGNRPMLCKRCGTRLLFEEIGTDRKCETCFLDTPPGTLGVSREVRT